MYDNNQPNKICIYIENVSVFSCLDSFWMTMSVLCRFSTWYQQKSLLVQLICVAWSKKCFVVTVRKWRQSLSLQMIYGLFHTLHFSPIPQNWFRWIDIDNKQIYIVHCMEWHPHWYKTKDKLINDYINVLLISFGYHTVNIYQNWYTPPKWCRSNKHYMGVGLFLYFCRCDDNNFSDRKHTIPIMFEMQSTE